MQVIVEISKMVGVNITVKAHGNAITVWVKDTESQLSRALLFKRPAGPRGLDSSCEAVGKFSGFDGLREAVSKINEEQAWEQPSVPPLSRETNEEFVVRMMNFARSGPLMQAFIIDAISKQAKKVAESDLKDDGDSIVNLGAWKACAVELHNEMQSKYGGG